MASQPSLGSSSDKQFAKRTYFMSSKTGYPSSLRLFPLCETNDLQLEVMSSEGCPIRQVPGRRDPRQEWAASWTGEQSTAIVEDGSDVVTPNSPQSGWGWPLPAKGEADVTTVGSVEPKVVSHMEMGLSLSDVDEVASVSTRWLESEKADSVFSLRTQSSTSTLFDEEQFLATFPGPATREQRAFMTKPSYAAAHRFCFHSDDDYKTCPRCSCMCVRENSFVDAMICVWCFSEGAAEDSWWFCWHCQAQTSSQGYNDSHYSILDCHLRSNDSTKGMVL
jgi:hypothetical protein